MTKSSRVLPTILGLIRKVYRLMNCYSNSSPNAKATPLCGPRLRAPRTEQFSCILVLLLMWAKISQKIIRTNFLSTVCLLWLDGRWDCVRWDPSDALISSISGSTCFLSSVDGLRFKCDAWYSYHGDPKTVLEWQSRSRVPKISYYVQHDQNWINEI